MRAAADDLTEFVGNRADVTACADGHGESGGLSFEPGDLEGIDDDGGGLEIDGLAGARELVGGSSGDLFRGERRRHLLQLAVKVSGRDADLVQHQKRVCLGADRRAFGVISVGGEAKADRARVMLFGGREVLREAGVFAEQEWEDAGSHGIERAEVADGLFAGDAAETADDVVAGDTGGFIYDEKAVHWFTLAARAAAWDGCGLNSYSSRGGRLC